MEEYKIKSEDFLKIKHLLDTRVFWKESEDGMIRVKTSNRVAKKLLNKYNHE